MGDGRSLPPLLPVAGGAVTAAAPWREARVDGAAIGSLAEAYAALAAALRLPAHFGANLDALWDSLTGDVAGPVELLWHDATATRAALGADFDRLVTLLREAE